MKISKILIPCFSLVTLLTSGAVYATWKYYDPIDEVSNNIYATLTDWYYEENLPGGGEDAEDDFNNGISHAGLIQDIINDISLYEPNTDHDSEIMGAIDGAIDDELSNGNDLDHNGVGSSTKYNGVQLRDFAGSRGYENLGFFIYYGEGITDVSDIKRIEIYTYTLSDSSSRVGTYIEVYKTVATLNDKGIWVLSGGLRGEAPTIQYGNKNTTGSYKNVIEPLKWYITNQ